MFDGADALFGQLGKSITRGDLHTDSPFPAGDAASTYIYHLGLMLAGKYLIDEKMKKRRAEAAAERALPNGETGNV
ncbi:hypothetical protein ACNKHP_00495 [Shigella boydii]